MPRTTVCLWVLIAILVTAFDGCGAFSPRLPKRALTSSPSSASSTTDQDQDRDAGGVLLLSLTKPLGVILEENVPGADAGVFVLEVSDTGSAASHADEILGCQLLTVMGKDVTKTSFDSVMETIIEAPDTVDLSFARKQNNNDDDDKNSNNNNNNNKLEFDVGTVVTIIAQQENGKDDLVFEAKVGDNLRQALLENGFEVYQGMKQKLGNCNGGGQCTFCAMDFIEAEGWEERVEYEDKKLPKNPNARLACLNPIQGPVTLRKAKR